jgi:hypothetical protein
MLNGYVNELDAQDSEIVHLRGTRRRALWRHVRESGDSTSKTTCTRTINRGGCDRQMGSSANLHELGESC